LMKRSMFVARDPMTRTHRANLAEALSTRYFGDQ
jgi:hypothetical protein